MKVIFVTGLQGVGKSRFIKEFYPKAVHLDIELWWKLAERRGPMDFYDTARWTKDMLHRQMLIILERKRKLITVEVSGMTMASQAYLSVLRDMARAYDYETEIVYLRPLDINVFLETLDGNDGAIRMLGDYMRGSNNFRQPHLCPYLRDVCVVDVDHSSWTWAEKGDRWCPHLDTVVETIGQAARISGGECDESLVDQEICLGCGKELA